MIRRLAHWLYWHLRMQKYALGVRLHHPLRRARLMWMRWRKQSVRFAVGDSHAEYTFWDIPRVIRLPLGPITMHRIGRDGFGFWPLRLWRPGDEVFFTFGEIDCRCHIAKQIAAGRTEDEIIATLADGYVKALDAIRREGIDFTLVSITPPAPANRLSDFRLFKPEGSDEDRARYTKKLNEQLQALASEHRFGFLDIYSAHTDERGMLPAEGSDGKTHIGDTTKVRELLSALQ